MSVNRYLEIDSSFRNRDQYPYPSNFVVEMAQSGQKSASTALDPVCNASPILVWNNSFTEAPWASNVVQNITVSPVGPPSADGTNVFQITSQTGPNQLRQVSGFYNGSALATSGTGTVFPLTPPITVRRILDYQPLNIYNAMVTVDSAIPDALAGVVGIWQIANSTPIATNTASSTIKFYVPAGVYGDNYYVNYLLQNMNTSEYKTIVGYDGLTRLATLDSPTLVDWLTIGRFPASTGQTGSAYNFVIRKQIPVSTGTVADVSQNGLSVQLNSYASNISDTYAGSYLRIVQTNNTGPNSTGPYSSPLQPYNQEMRIVKYLAGDGLISAVSGSVVTLNSTTSNSTNDYYVGGMLTDSTQSTGAQVIAYNGSTRQATLYSSIGAVVGDAWTMRTAVLQRSFTISPFLSATGLLNKNYEVEMYTRDNSVPFVYSGSLVSSEQMVCYEVELLNLTLPNTILASGRGGRAIFYPYLYVELQQVSGASAGNKGIIYSNNPNAYTMLFRAVVDDTPIPAISPFIKIDGDGMVHTIKFKPNDAFRFSVRHPNNGELFRTVIQDTSAPTEPNPLAQISACFAFKRKD